MRDRLVLWYKYCSVHTRQQHEGGRDRLGWRYEKGKKRRRKRKLRGTDLAGAIHADNFHAVRHLPLHVELQLAPARVTQEKKRKKELQLAVLVLHKDLLSRKRVTQGSAVTKTTAVRWHEKHCVQNPPRKKAGTDSCVTRAGAR